MHEPDPARPQALHSEQFYRQLAALVADLVYEESVRPGGPNEVVFLGLEVTALTGYTAQALRRRGGWASLVVPEDEPVLALRERELRAGRIAHAEFRILTRDGRVKVVKDVARPVCDPDTGEVLTVIGALRDITLQRRSERELVAAKERAEELSQLKSAFLANMSHEIRTPLTTILGFASLLADEAPESLREYTNVIQRSGQRLLETLNSVLDLSMLEAHAVRVRPGDFDLVTELEDKVLLFHSVAEEKGVAVELVECPATLPVCIDRGCFDRILNNLLGNAVKFTPSGRVTVRLREQGDDFLLSIEDTGVGISPDFLPRLFQEFNQESTGINRTHEGNGLGLAITKRLVDLLGGKIGVDSTKGVGTTFTVRLPRAHGPSPEAGARVDAPGRAAPRRLLILEDHPETAALIERMLAPSGTPRVVATPAEVLAEAGRGGWDAILLDIHLGEGATGDAVLMELRDRLGTTLPPVIAMTAYALPGDESRLRALGFDGYLAKPFNVETLDRVLAEVVATGK